MSNKVDGLTIMHKDTPQMYIEWDEELNIKSKWLIDDPSTSFLLPMIYPENITISGFMNWLESRTVPKTRIGLNDLLKHLYHLPEYAPLKMCKLDHGVQYADFIWIKWDGEDLCYDDIRVR